MACLPRFCSPWSLDSWGKIRKWSILRMEREQLMVSSKTEDSLNYLTCSSRTMMKTHYLSGVYDDAGLKSQSCHACLTHHNVVRSYYLSYITMLTDARGTMDIVRHTPFPWEPRSLENSVSAKDSLSNHLSSPDANWDGEWVVKSSTWCREACECVCVCMCTLQQELGQQFVRYFRN